jgi:protein-serine/threonine kinase
MGFSMASPSPPLQCPLHELWSASVDHTLHINTQSLHQVEENLPPENIMDTSSYIMASPIPSNNSTEINDTQSIEHKFLSHRLDEACLEIYMNDHLEAPIYVTQDEHKNELPQFYITKTRFEDLTDTLNNTTGGEEVEHLHDPKSELKKLSSFRDVWTLFATLTKKKHKEEEEEKTTSPTVLLNATTDTSKKTLVKQHSSHHLQNYSPPPTSSPLKKTMIISQPVVDDATHHPAEETLSTKTFTKPSPRRIQSFRDLFDFFKGGGRNHDEDETHHDPYYGHLTDKYEIVDKLGKGSGGIVRLARKLNTTNKLYAVKEFTRRRSRESERDLDKRVTSEFCIGSLLHHTNIVETVDIIHEGTHWYEVMEYCSGGDLYTIIRNSHMTVMEIDCYFKQLLQGLAYLHSVGVAHRDIKPENLLINELGHLKISDFGVSSVFQVAWEHEEHKFRGVCGSKPYIAPEVFSNREYDARKVDVWACGIVYYAMHFNGVPWMSATPSDTCYSYYLRHRDMNFSPFTRLEKDTKELLRQILEPDPHRRITIQEILKTDWFKRIECCVDKSSPSKSHYRPHRHFVGKKFHGFP